MNYDMKTLARDFWYGKPHQERRLGDLYIDKTGLYKHREWRGFKDTMYYFYNIWMYNYAHMVMDVVRYGGLINFAKGVWRYRWVGQTYLCLLYTSPSPRDSFSTGSTAAWKVCAARR